MRAWKWVVCALPLIAVPASGPAQKAQYSVEDIVGSFDCGAGMVEAPNGECRPAPRTGSSTRGFSLAKPNQPKAAARPRPKTRNLLITFANNSATLTPQARANARVFADAVNSAKLAKARFAIEGHTNAIGSAESNLRLSQQRAQALADELVADGVDRSRLDTAGYGFERPIKPRDPRAAVNRRVEARRVAANAS